MFQHDFEKACASIILHVVKGYCIKEVHGHNETKPNLPSKEFFIEELFNHKKYLSEEDLESIAESLGIGKKSSESTASSSSESHDGHNHRHRRSAASAVSSQEESAASHTLLIYLRVSFSIMRRKISKKPWDQVTCWNESVWNEDVFPNSVTAYRWYTCSA